MSGRTFSQNTRKRAKGHHLNPPSRPDDIFYSVWVNVLGTFCRGICVTFSWCLWTHWFYLEFFGARLLKYSDKEATLIGIANAKRELDRFFRSFTTTNSWNLISLGHTADSRSMIVSSSHTRNYAYSIFNVHHNKRNKHHKLHCKINENT